ncbi:MAG: glycosyltransferase family 1 protein [Actinomycetota bacterium]
MKAVVTGVIATYPVGGVAWDYGQYALGLEKLGFDVWYLEDSGLDGYDPERNSYTDDPSYGVRFLADSLAFLSPTLADRWHHRTLDGRTAGVPADEMAEIVAEADVFLNVSGMCLMREEYLPSRRKVLLDTDPGWNHFVVYPRMDGGQLWPGTHGYRSHDWFFTYAQCLGHPGCALPSLGLPWHPTRPPVVSDAWSPRPPGERWTTVMTWDNYGAPIEYEGITYGSKEPQLAAIETLPGRVPACLEMAVGGVGAPVDRWREEGWSIVDSPTVSSTAACYRNYVAGSRGELSVAKNVYVATNSGWFSCRSVCYLAAGRPVVVEDTGFSEVVPTGEGLLAFRTVDEAAAAVQSVERDYAAHQDAARSVVAAHFDSDVVLAELLDTIGAG